MKITKSILPNYGQVFCVKPHLEIHNPVFKESISAEWPSRKQMGLPESYTSPCHENAIAISLRNIRQISDSQLVRIVEDPLESLYDRLAAGRLLALIGDPRIIPLSPAMTEIVPSDEITLGLNPKDIIRIQRDSAMLGVLDDWIEKECPEYTMRMNRYGLSVYPVTNAEYAIFLEETEHLDIPQAWLFGRLPREKSNHPVHTIRPESADAYAVWLSGKTGRKFRLPSEAEWEYAAAGPKRFDYPWGNVFLPGIVNTAELGLFDTTPVGCFPEGNSFFGIKDMAGNVEEYVADTYEPYPGGRVIEDALYKIDPNYRVARGGSFTRFRDLARTRRRHGWNKNSPVYVMGFRLAEEL
jgi:toxoflavin biosynthesis protein ToxD